MSVEVRLFGDVAHALLVGDRVKLNRAAVEEDLTAGHFDETGDHLHGGGFAGAVGSQISGDCSRMRGVADVVDSSDAGKSFRDAAEFEHGSRPSVGGS